MNGDGGLDDPRGKRLEFMANRNLLPIDHENTKVRKHEEIKNRDATLSWLSEASGKRRFYGNRASRDSLKTEERTGAVYFTLASTICQAADSASITSPSFDVTATVIFLPGMNATSAYHIVFDPLCQ